MFILKTINHVVRIPPNLFHIPRVDAITTELNKKLANKVLHKVGLCMTLYDIVNIGDSYIIPGDGASHMKVTFRYIIFRPFVNEAIVGKVKLCDSEGIHVTLTFFDDIIIPMKCMPDNSNFNPVQSTWIWKYKQTPDGETHDMPTEKGDEIRFKVVELEFNDITPTPADQAPITKNKPFRIIGRTNDPGLGLSSWWVNPEGEAEEEEEVEDDDDEEEEDSVEGV